MKPFVPYRSGIIIYVLIVVAIYHLPSYILNNTKLLCVWCDLSFVSARQYNFHYVGHVHCQVMQHLYRIWLRFGWLPSSSVNFMTLYFLWNGYICLYTNETCSRSGPPLYACGQEWQLRFSLYVSAALLVLWSNSYYPFPRINHKSEKWQILKDFFRCWSYMGKYMEWWC